MEQVHVVNHPLVQHKLTLMRRKDTSTVKFRNLMREISQLIGYEVTRTMVLTDEIIETPLATMNAKVLAKKRTALVSILRAGNGLLDGILNLMPTARVGHIGLYRDPLTDSVIEYYFKLPIDISDRKVLVLDPMLATGQSAVAAVSRLKETRPLSIEFVCLLASPEGLEYFHARHPDVKVFTAQVDEGLNEKNYIIPGLGDAGDRLYGTL